MAYLSYYNWNTCEEFENMESVQFFDVSSSHEEVKEWSEHISNKIKEYENRQTAGTCR